MSNTIKTTPESISAGEIKFYDSIQPPLPAGDYTLSAKQEILGITGQTVDPYLSNQPLLVNGPRFTLNPSQINSVFPPANQEGSFSNYLPNIVFNNFTLPWSREINPPVSTAEIKARQKAKLGTEDADINQIPWMGLLTFYPEDLDDTKATPKVSAPVSVTLKQLVSPGGKILPPALGVTHQPDSTKISVIDVDLSFFQAVSPTLEELPFLAHAREVNTDGKAMLGLSDGSYSLLIGNRVPKAASKNTIMMVSYEGHQDHLRGKKISGDYDQIRLVVLGSWEFNASPNLGSFLQLMGDLCDKGRGGVKLFQMPFDPTSISESQEAEEAIKIGYIPLQNELREGEESTSWYRGPTVPAPTKRDFTYGPYVISDHAIHFDPETGIFNQAYSSAWQIGRLLALSDASFASSMFNWRNKYLKSVIDDSLNQVATEKAANLGLMAGITDQKTNFVTGTKAVLATALKNADIPKVKTRTEATLGSHLAGVLSAKDRAVIHENDEDPIIALNNKLKVKA